MARFPYFGFPFQYPYYNRYYNQYSNNTEENLKKQNNENENIEKDSSVQAIHSSQTRKTSSKNNQFLPFNFNFDGFNNSYDPIIELLGIKLYLDDIIILCLLFVLYKEEVKDEMLFISLILLLLS